MAAFLVGLCCHLPQSLEVRLHRALEEVSQQKEAVRQAQGQSKDLGQEQRLVVAKLETQNQRLERQKVMSSSTNPTLRYSSMWKYFVQH